MKTSFGPKRLSGLAPSLACGLVLLLSACATSAPRPPAPISSGDPRVDPVQEIPEDVAEAPEETGLEDLEPKETEDAAGALPPHMVGREVVRAAVLLPFSHSNRNVRAEAEGILAGIEMGVFEHADENFLIIPKDTGGTASGAEAATRSALNEGVDIVLGPLFSSSVQAAASTAKEDNVPLLAFSNDRAAAGNGAYLASIGIEEEIAEIVAYARSRGVESFAFLGPENSYGRRIESALRFETARLGGQVIASGFYSPSNDAPVQEAAAVASALSAEAARIPNRVAVLIPERGVKLRAVAPLLPYSGVDTRYVVFLGTSQWNDPTVWREPTLINGFFPAAPSADIGKFERDFERIYGGAPTGLASLGYDAAALASSLAAAGDPFDRVTLTDPNGYRGVNGLFRFRVDGTAERGLSIMQITKDEGAIEVQPGAARFGDDA
ncbi:MAG: penicillin-binding protein activator [Pseudomonadota bacterium]